LKIVTVPEKSFELEGVRRITGSRIIQSTVHGHGSLINLNLATALGLTRAVILTFVQNALHSRIYLPSGQNRQKSSL